MGQFTTFSYTVVVLFIVYRALSYIQARIARSQKSKSLGCEDPPRYPHVDPLFGWDLFINNLRAFKEKRFLRNVKERFDLYGHTFSCIAMGREAFVTNDPQNIQAVHGHNFNDYGVQPARLAPTSPFMGHGIFNTDGPFWQHSRALVRPTFTRSNVANLPAFEVHFEKFLKLVPVDGSTVDLKPLLYNLFIDTSTEFLFGESMHTLDPTTPFAATEFLEAFHYCQAAMGLRIQMGRLRFLHRDKKWQESIRIVHSFADKYVNKALAYRESYLAQQKTKAVEDDDSKGRYILLEEMAKDTSDPVELRSQIIQVFLAGHDSSSITIGNVMFNLCRNPEMWRKLREEVSTLGKDGLTFESLKNMHYLQYIIKETLRLQPVAPTDTRVALRDTILPIGGGKDGKSPILVTAGQIVMTSTHALHRRPEHWGKENVEHFVPERWENCRPGWHYLPFMGGPRICPGQNLALTEIAYIVARLAQEWKEIVCKDDTWEWIEEVRITAGSGNGCKLAITPA